MVMWSNNIAAKIIHNWQLFIIQLMTQPRVLDCWPGSEGWASRWGQESTWDYHRRSHQHECSPLWSTPPPPTTTYSLRDYSIIESRFRFTVKPGIRFAWQIKCPSAVNMSRCKWKWIHAGFTKSKSSFRCNNQMHFLTESERGFTVNLKPDSIIEYPLNTQC